MVNWGVFGPTVLGAAISGIIGVIVIEYRSRKQNYAQLKRWYSRVERLAQRVDRVNYGDWTDPKPKIAKETCAGIHSELSSHVVNAPPPVDDSLLSLCEQLIAECQKVKMVELEYGEVRQSTEVETRVKETADIAKLVEEEAEKKRESIGFR